MRVAYPIEPPFNYVDDAGAVTGCDVELARYVLDQLDIGEVEFVETEFAQLLPGLARDDWQMTTGLFASPERQRVALFSRSIWALPDGLLVRKEDAQCLAGYRSLAVSGDLKLAVIRDQVQHVTALELGVTPGQFCVFETYADAVRAVEDGTVSAFASVARAHQGFLQTSSADGLAVVDVPLLERAPAYGCFAFALTANELRNRVDQVLNTFIGGTEHRKLMKAFGFADADVDRIL
ncbi:transporter substrate-binding domain-containing protein [uncultured Roseobacter sp.]|uniref:transporter substrate-binding domain-containing protein n=1 Tax=uncultured Roseobacter sp. TaxID=114847 RepID=UPI00261FE489|nr:transporter substrate-binding domain-containing protein [uncultured Roseobacter sp.]